MAKSAVIGSLRVNLGVQTAEFDKGLKNAQRGLSQFGDQMKIVAASLAAIGTGVAVAVGSSMKEFDRLAKTASRIGVPVEALTALGHAAEMSGVPMRTLEMALQRFSRRTAEAAQGSGELVGTLEKYGIAIRDGEGRLRDQVEILRDLADVMQNATSDQERLRIAFKAFDSEGAVLVNMLKDGSGALDAMMAEARALGLVIDGETAQAAENFGDNLSRLSGVASGLTRTVAAGLVPALESFSATAVRLSMAFRDLSPQTQQWVSGLAAATVGLGAAAGAALLVVPALRALSGAFTLAWAAATGPVGLVVVGLGSIATGVYLLRDDIQRAIGVDIPAVFRDTANFLANSFQVGFEAIGFAAMRLPAMLGSVATRIANGWLAGMEDLGNGTLDVFNAIIDKANDLAARFGGDWLQQTLGWDLSLGTLDPIVLPRLDTASADRLEMEVTGFTTRVGEIMQRDLVGDLAGAFTRPVGQISAAMGELAQATEAAGGKAAAAAKKATAALDPLAAAAARVVDATRTPLERFHIEMEQLNVLLEAGKIDLETYRRAAEQAGDALIGVAGSARTAVGDLAGATTELEQAGLSMGRSLADSLEGLATGARNATEVISDLLRQLGRLLMDRAFNSLIGGGSGGGLFGNLFGGGAAAPKGGYNFDQFATAAMPGFATGGSFTVGGTGGIDSQTVAFRATPGEMVDISRPGQDRGGETTVRVEINGATGNSEVLSLVQQGVADGIRAATPGIVQRAGEHVQVSRASDPHWMTKRGG